MSVINSPEGVAIPIDASEVRSEEAVVAQEAAETQQPVVYGVVMWKSNEPSAAVELIPYLPAFARAVSSYILSGEISSEIEEMRNQTEEAAWRSLLDQNKSTDRHKIIARTHRSLEVTVMVARKAAMANNSYGSSVEAQRRVSTVFDDLFGSKDKLPQTAATEDTSPPLRMHWERLGKCATLDPDLMMPGRGESTKEAKDACSNCDVQRECLVGALSISGMKGIRAGTSERERRKLHKDMTKQKITPLVFVDNLIQLSSLNAQEIAELRSK